MLHFGGRLNITFVSDYINKQRDGAYASLFSCLNWTQRRRGWLRNNIVTQAFPEIVGGVIYSKCGTGPVGAILSDGFDWTIGRGPPGSESFTPVHAFAGRT